jgi:hypothetical protein
VERVDQRQDVAGHGGGHVAEVEFTGGAVAGRGRSRDRRLDLGVGRAEFVEELPAERGQVHPAGGPGEQGRPEPALKFLDRLADRGRGHAQTPCGAGEVQLLGQREEDLDVLPFHSLIVHPG